MSAAECERDVVNIIHPASAMQSAMHARSVNITNLNIGMHAVWTSPNLNIGMHAVWTSPNLNIGLNHAD